MVYKINKNARIEAGNNEKFVSRGGSVVRWFGGSEGLGQLKGVLCYG